MAHTAYLPIIADRYGAVVRHIFVVGLDLTGIDMRAQVRLYGDVPGSPLVDLLTVSNGNAQGLRLVEVTSDAIGIPTSHVELVINESTMEALPYAGEIGDVTTLAWDWQVTIASRKRRLAKGEFQITGDGVTGASSAPTNRVQPYGLPQRPVIDVWSSARLTFGEDQVTVQIDGADLVAPLAKKAADAATRAEAGADKAGLAAGAAQATARYFTTRAAGEAASAVDQSFATDDGAGSVIYYRRTASGSTEIGRAVTPAALAGAGGAGMVGFSAAGAGAVARTMRDKGRETLSVADFGASPGKSAAENDAAFAAAVAAAPTVDYPTAGPTLLIPPGSYNISAFPALAAKSLTIVGHGAELIITGPVAFDLGADAYITDLTIGYYTVIIQGLRLTLPAGGVGIKNRGLRHLILDSVRTFGGATALDIEGAFAMSSATNCRFQQTTSHIARIRQRNNLFTFYSCAFLAGGGNGVLIDTTSFGSSPGNENKGLKFIANDWEGCQGAIYISGNVSNVLIVGAWFESNFQYALKLDNTAGSFNKYGLTIQNAQITGVDVLIGTDANGTTIEGVTIADCEFAGSDLVVIPGDSVKGLSIIANRQSEGATFTIPSAGLLSLSGQGLPRYSTAPQEPFGSEAAGHQGDIRYGPGRVAVKTDYGWGFAQLQKIPDHAAQIAVLPAGSSPNVQTLMTAQTGNTSPTSITNLAGGYAGQLLVIRGLDGGQTTIVDNANLALAGNVSFTLGDDDTITLMCVNGAKWVEVARSNN